MYLNLKLSLLRLGLRQNQVAQALCLDEALLSRIINGFREPTASQRRLIAEFLREEEEWLFARHPIGFQRRETDLPKKKLMEANEF